MSALTVILSDFECELVIGLRPLEQEKPQRVVINVEVEVDNKGHVFNDRGESSTKNTFDYSELVAFLRRKLPQEQPFLLLETLASRIAEFCRTSANAGRTRVKVSKPDCYHDASGVSVIVEAS